MSEYKFKSNEKLKSKQELLLKLQKYRDTITEEIDVVEKELILNNDKYKQDIEIISNQRSSVLKGYSVSYVPKDREIMLRQCFEKLQNYEENKQLDVFHIHQPNLMFVIDGVIEVCIFLIQR